MVQLIRRRWAQRRVDARGAMAILVAICTLIMFVLAAFVVDLGLARDTRRQAQNAADASALAAGTVLYTLGTTPRFAEAVAAAKSYAELNYGVQPGDWATCQDPAALPHQPGGTECISFNSDSVPTQIRVVAPVRQVSTPLASVFSDISSVPVSALAEIGITPNARSRCALCVVGSGPHDLQNGNVEVSGGDIHFNGSVSVGPNGLVATDGAITVEGTASGGTERYEPDPLMGQPPIADPLGFLPPIDYSTLSPKSDPCTGGPGIYGDFSANCLTMLPGLYVITGKWSFAGSESLIGAGVTLYFTCGSASAPRPCNPGEAGGWLDASGNGTIQISAPLSGPTKGLAIVYDRNNDADLRLTGNGLSQYTGTIYAPAATLDYRGNALGTPDSLVIVGSLRFSGTNASLQPEYDDSENVDMPPADLHLSR